MFRFVKCLPVGLLFLIFQPAAIAQNDDFIAGARNAGGLNASKAYRQVTRTRTVIETHMEEIPEEERQRLEEFQTAVQEIREKHESSEEKERARAALETLVIEQMDRDLETREKQLAEIEVQAKQLREQLEQRKAAKPEFVKLIMIMIENPAAGIGLPSEWMNSIGPSPQPVTDGVTYGARPVYPGQAPFPTPGMAVAPTQARETRQGRSTGSAKDLAPSLPRGTPPAPGTDAYKTE